MAGDKINILYLRKSSEDKNVQIQSIDGQRTTMMILAKKLGIEIDKEFEDVKTARFPYQRFGFDQMKELIYKGRVENLIVWKLDRLSRNMLEAGIIIDFLQRGFLSSIITGDKVFNANENVLIASIEFGIANEEVKKLSQNVKRGLAYKNMKGIKPGKACIGYINEVYAPKGLKRILPDPDKFEKVKLLFEKAAEEKHTLKSLSQYCETIRLVPAKSKRFSKNSIRNILKDPFYYGMYCYGGNEYQGTHTQMISKNLFDSIQNLYFEKGRSNVKHKNIYNRLFKCGECGYSIVPESPKLKLIKSTGKTKAYKYWRCMHNSPTIVCSQKSVTEEMINRKIQSDLVKIEMNDELSTLILIYISKILKNNENTYQVINFIQLYSPLPDDKKHTQDLIKKDLTFCQAIVNRFNVGNISEKRKIVENIYEKRIVFNKQIILEKRLKYKYMARFKRCIETVYL
jgi:site-specific DNA recombinase